jgi:tricorn protease
MILSRHLGIAILLVLVPALSGAVEAPLPRHPAPSPDGSQIAFSWQGDLWVVGSAGGTARRLTAHPAAERHPVWSRDGRWIAFASDRYGHFDVFVLPTDGSEAPRRLTHASSHDTPLDFTVDNGAVLFRSARAESIRWMQGLYRVPVAGGTPILQQGALGRRAAFSPDGAALAYVRGSTKWTRSGYRGAANRDLWLRTADGDDVQLTDFDGDDDCPGWVDGHTLAFLSSRAGRKNVFLLDLITSAAEPLTAHTGTDVRFPRLSADGRVLAYEFEDRIWTLAIGDDEPRRLSVDVPADQVVNPTRRVTATSGAEELAVRPDGELAAFVVHGDVFITAIMSKEDQEIARPPTVQVTDTAAREKDICWSPDGERLLFASARSGSYDLFLARPADPDSGWIDSFDFTTEVLTASPAEDHLGRFSPDGTRIAFVRGKGELVVVDADGGNEVVLLDHWDTPTFDWSPDGAWITYSTPDVHYNSEIWIVPAAGGEPYNLSRHPDDDVGPSWSPDGKRLVWLTKRHADTMDVWGTWLARADHERTPAEWLKYWKEKNGKKGTNGSDEDGAAKDSDDDAEKASAPELPEVSIDMDGLWERATAISNLKGDEAFARVSPDGKRVIFTADHEGERDLYSVRWDGEDIRRLTSGGEQPSAVQFDGDGSTVFYLDQKGLIKRVGLDGKAGDPIPYQARFEIDTLAERAAVFDEAWRALNEWFYDPDFHGADWKKQYDTYRPWALEASHQADFDDVLNLMLGELNASHMGYWSRGDADGETTGWIGVVFDSAAGGPGIRVAEVLPDTPADHHDVRLRAGERILAVNGRPVEDDTNVFSLFTDTVKQRVALEILGEDGATRQAVVIPKPFATQEEARYDHWVKQRRKLVEASSGGRLGYLHIQGMSIPSFEEFERDLYAAGHGKDGLIIDVRSNGGGWTTDYLMAVLSVRRHAFTVPRDADTDEKAYPQGRLPLAAWTKPALALCNEESYSNAEIFSHAFQNLDRGLLVGAPTFGAVISTSGTTLVNGGWVRLPMRGWYVAATGMNMENHGAQPDIVVWQPPAEDTSADHDTQLERAVEVFLANLEDDPRYGAW